MHHKEFRITYKRIYDGESVNRSQLEVKQLQVFSVYHWVAAQSSIIAV
jgi:hypothetical protein